MYKYRYKYRYRYRGKWTRSPTHAVAQSAVADIRKQRHPCEQVIECKIQQKFFIDFARNPFIRCSVALFGNIC